MLTVLFLGDIVGEPGRNAVIGRLPQLKEKQALDFIIVNGENAAGGRGITGKITIELLRIAVRQNPRALLIYRNQVRRETVGAINVINQSGELVTGNCLLIFSQHVPPGMSAKNSEIVRSVAGGR